jgi:hypothetical protein
LPAPEIIDPVAQIVVDANADDLLFRCHVPSPCFVGADKCCESSPGASAGIYGIKDIY